MAEETVIITAQKISVLFEERMRLKGPNLERQVYKAGRNLPRKLRKDAHVVLQALQVADHPKLSRMINRVQFDKAARNLIAHLSAIDPRDVAIGRLLTFLGKVSAVLIVGFVLVVWFLWSRGLV